MMKTNNERYSLNAIVLAFAEPNHWIKRPSNDRVEFVMDAQFK